MKILILGAGAIGSNLTRYLASTLPIEIDLSVLDYDTVEDRNVQVGTQFFYRDQVGLKKVDALQYNIFQLTGREIKIHDYEVIDAQGLTILLVNETLPPGETEVIFDAYDLVVDCFDNKEAREAAKEACIKTQIPCIHVGFSPNMTFEIEWNDAVDGNEYQVPETADKKFDICERQGAAAFVNMVSAVAASAIEEWLLSDTRFSFTGNRFSVRRLI